MTDFDRVKDSGTRQEFSTGAVRDVRAGKGRYDLMLSLSHMFYRLARHFENGAVKYGDDNWLKGFPLRRFLDSAFRHLCQFSTGNTDEDHLTAVIWNLMCLGETAYRIEMGLLPCELDDLPKYTQRSASSAGVWHDLHTIGNRIAKKMLDQAEAQVEPAIGLDLATPGSDKTVRVNPEVPTFYITGPMRGYVQFNFPAFDAAAKLLRKQGCNVISPADLDRAEGLDPMTDPDAFEKHGVQYPDYLRKIAARDTRAILSLDPAKRDGMALLPGWEKSTGARAEVALGLWLGLNFKFIVDTDSVPGVVPYLVDAVTAGVRRTLFGENVDA